MGKAARRKKEQRKKKDVELGDDALTIRGKTLAHGRAEAARVGRQGHGATTMSDLLKRGAQAMTPDTGDRIGFPVNVEGREGTAYPFTPDENGDAHMEPLPLAKLKAVMTTAMVANLSRLAREQPWCSKALSETDVARLDPHGKHVVLAAFRHTTTDWKRENVRAHVYLRLRGQEEPYERMVDFTSWHFGVAVAQFASDSDYADDLIVSLLENGIGSLRERPNWMAARAFPKVWSRCTIGLELFSLWHAEGPEGMAQTLAERKPSLTPDEIAALVEAAVSPRILGSAAAMAALSQARLIVAEPEWVQGIDDSRPSSRAVFDWFKEKHLPFDDVFLDFEGPGGNMPTLPVGKMELSAGREYEVVARLSGASVRKLDSGGIEVIPFCSPLSQPEHATTPYEPCGRYVLYDGEPPEDRHLANTSVDGVEQEARVLVFKGSVVDPEAADTRIEVMLDPKDFQDNLDHRNFKEWARMVYAAAMRALRVIYMFQAGSNVELVEAKLTREGVRKLKRAEKRGWPIMIGEQVAVHWHKKLYYRPPDIDHLPEERGYSHAHWRSGHPNYYPLGTQMADALARRSPEKLVPHPEKGPCRMVWHPPVIVGKFGEDGQERAPVEKTRRLVGPAPPDVEPPPEEEAA